MGSLAWISEGKEKGFHYVQIDCRQASKQRPLKKHWSRNISITAFL